MVTLVPHTHWDREWYDPFPVFLTRLVSMMDTLLDLGERGFPHFHLDGQTAMIDDYLAERPERAADVARLVLEGRLSAGPWVTQMDEFLVSGESHVRNLEMGMARAEALGGASKIGYLPDQFGHIGQMPQLLRRAGIERAVVWRGVPATVDRTVFRWESPDGSAVLTEYLAFGYSLGWDVPRLRTPEQLSAGLRDKLARIAPFLAGDRVVITVGSDHAGPDADLPDRLSKAAGLLGDLTVRIGSLDDHARAGPEPQDVPRWRGELRSAARAHLLPNVYSARAHQKRERGRLEALIERYAEPLAALVPGVSWPAERLDRAWTLLLWNGAHDSVCGCSHDQVARDVDARHAEVRSLGEMIVAEALTELGARASAPGVLRLNPSPFERDGVPALGWRVDPERVPSEEVSLTPSVGADGWIEVGHLAFGLFDEPDVGDLYTFCPASDDRAPDPPAEVRIGPGTVEARWDGLDVRIHLRRRAGDDVLRLGGAIENRRPDHRLRLHVRLPEPATGSAAGAPFELVDRPLRSEGSEHEAPSPTWPARHVVLAGGVALFHEGVFEYEVADRELRVTLLRCVGTISRDRLVTRPFAAGPAVPTPEAQMIGRTEFSLGVRAGAHRQSLFRDWERFAMPVLEVPTSGGGPMGTSGTLLEIAGDAELSTVRRRDGLVEVRLWNPRSDRAVEARVGSRPVPLGPAAIETVRLG
ncbi:MAG TPA: hypothetical protein VF129_14265 [Actinomycetota bacterium]